MNEEHLKFIVKRIDFNIASTNAKLLVLLGANIFMISSFIVNYFQLESMIKTSFWTEFWSMVSFFGMLISCLISLVAILPSSKSKDSIEDERSVLTTASISKESKHGYQAYFQADDYDFLDDLSKQVIQVSKESEDKKLDLKRALYALLVFVGLPWLLIGLYLADIISVA